MAQESTSRPVPKFASFKPAVPTPTPPPANELDDKKRSRSRERRRRSKERSGSRKQGHRSKRDRADETGEPDEETEKRRHCERKKRKNEDRGHEEHEERDRRREKERKDKAKRHRSRSSRRERHRHRSLSRSRTDTKEVIQHPPPSEPSQEPQLYRIDTSGDRFNAVYGTIHRYDVPRYYRVGSGQVLGLPSYIRIDQSKPEEHGKIFLLSGRENPKSFGKRHRNNLARFRDGGRLLRPKDAGSDASFVQGLDYVAVGGAKKRKRDEDDEEEMAADHYRSVEGMKKHTDEPDDVEMEYASESDEDGEHISTDAWADGGRKIGVEMMRKVDKEPHNIEAWLEYVEHQSALLKHNGRKTTVAERMSTAEVQLDILEKALKENPGNEQLLVKYMQIAEAVWDAKKMLAKWKRMLIENPTVTALWTRYINFRQTDFTSFTYPECVTCFKECFDVLMGAIFKCRDTKDRERLEEIFAYVFLRSTLMMRQAGYRECAVAAFQGMLELNFFHPSNLPPQNPVDSHAQSLDELENFWDSEVVRIGEKDAQGWAAYVAAGENGTVPEPIVEKMGLPALDEDDPFGSWTDAEVEWSKTIGMPARTSDEVEDEDAYRVVLFSDIRSFLFRFSSESARRKLVQCFLKFHGLPPVPYAEPLSSCYEEYSDTFLRNELVDAGGEALRSWFWARDEEKERKLIALDGMMPERKSGMGGDAFGFRFSNYPLGPETLFSPSSHWLNGLKPLVDLNAIDVDFVTRTLKMLVDNGADEDLAVYYLAWERRGLGSIKQVAMALLKRFKTSLRLYAAYAQTEWQDGNVDVARNVFSAALGLSKGFPETKKRDTVLLWQAWVWAELAADNAAGALRILLSMDAEKPAERLKGKELGEIVPGNVPGPLLLQIRAHLSSQSTNLLAISLHHAAVCTELHAILEYLSSRSLTPALEIYDTFITALSSANLISPHSSVYELTILRKSRLLYHHTTTSTLYTPSLLRTTLEHALDTFPHNTAFLNLYAWNEDRTKIENRVRNVLRDKILVEGKESVLGWVFALWVELHAVRVNPHTIRSTFGRAVDCARTSASISLWTLYIDFELQQREPRRAKDVFFRAVAACPWSKDLMMLGFTKLSAVMSFEDKQRLLSLIANEKEIRVHDVSELEVVLEDIAGREVEGVRRGFAGAVPVDVGDEMREDRD